MKRIFIILSVAFFCFQYSFAQQIIGTNKKHTCTYNGTTTLQSCSEENINAVFTFNENTKIFVHQVNGVDVTYAIESRTFTNPDWTYRISDSEGVMYDLKLNQVQKVFTFYPVVLTEGTVVVRYQYN